MSKLSLDEMLELAVQVAVERRAAKEAAAKAAEAAKVVTLAVSNPDVRWSGNANDCPRRSSD
jgi:hypothetical protein